jgi:hypothetical protein
MLIGTEEEAIIAVHVKSYAQERIDSQVRHQLKWIQVLASILGFGSIAALVTLFLCLPDMAASRLMARMESLDKEVSEIVVKASEAKNKATTATAAAEFASTTAIEATKKTEEVITTNAVLKNTDMDVLADKIKSINTLFAQDPDWIHSTWHEFRPGTTWGETVTAKGVWRVVGNNAELSVQVMPVLSSGAISSKMGTVPLMIELPQDLKVPPAVEEVPYDSAFGRQCEDVGSAIFFLPGNNLFEGRTLLTSNPFYDLKGKNVALTGWRMVAYIGYINTREKSWDYIPSSLGVVVAKKFNDEPWPRFNGKDCSFEFRASFRLAQ